MFEKLKKLLSTKPQKNNLKTHNQPKPQIQSIGEEKKTAKPAPCSKNRSSKEKKKTGEGKKQKKADKYTKTGIKKIAPKEDLYLLFQADREEKSDQESKKGAEFLKSKPNRQLQKNKHGFPIFDKQNDYLAVFTGQKPEKTKKNVNCKTNSHPDDSETDFTKLLNKSLKGQTFEKLLAEKKDLNKSEKPLTARQKIKFYPPPQAILDLHGYTAAKAEQKAETFLRNAYRRETKTLLIIVGKGLHSEGHAVLPDVVENILVRLKQDNLVLSYEWENRKKARSGAVIVYLQS